MTEPNTHAETQATFCNAISPSGFGCSLSPGHTGPHVAEGTHDGDYEEWAKSAVAPDPRDAELSALRKQLESSQGTISEYRRVVHRNSDDLREMVEEVRAAKRECDAAQTAARQAGRQDAATYILTHPYCREVDRMQDLCDCRPMAEDIIAGEKLPPLSSLPVSAPATGEQAPAETPEALCVCGHPKSKHRPNGVCYHRCGPYLTCNCGKFEAFAPPVAPSAPATTGDAVRVTSHSDTCHKVSIVAGNQTIAVGLEWETRAEADWYAEQTRRVIAKISAPSPMEAHAAEAPSGDAEHPAAQEQFHLPVNMPADRSAMIERANAADDGCISAGAPSPRGQDTFVPGLWKCSTCGFVQQNQTLYVGNGSVGVSDEDATHPDLCPNDGLLMERVTWKEHAEEAVKSSLAWAERAIAAEKKLAASAHSALEAHAANAMTASGEAGDLRSVLLRIIDNYGPWHDDDCPGDDTCDCSCKPLSDEINRVLKASEASGEAERRVVEAAKVYVKAIRDTGIDDEEQSRRYGILEEAVDALAQPTPAEVKATEQTPDVWTASADGEAYMGRFGSRDEAIADLGGRAGYVGTVQEIGPGDYASGHAELVIDNIVSQVEADISEAEGNPRRNRDDVKQLDAALTQVVEKWLEGRFDVSRVVNVEEIPAAQPTPAPEAKPTELLDPCRFQRGDVITDGQGRWEVVVADKRGMAKLHNLATGKDEDWNAFNNRRFWKVEAMKVPTPAPSQDAEQQSNTNQGVSE